MPVPVAAARETSVPAPTASGRVHVRTRHGLARFDPAPAQVGPGRMRQVVAGQLASREEGIDQFHAVLGTVAHRHRRRPIQLDHGRRLHLEEQVVKGDDLAPIGGSGVGRAGMHCSDGCLNGIGPESPRRSGLSDQRQAFRDQFSVPEASILVVEEDEFTVRRHAGQATRLLKEHEREQSENVRLRQ